MNTWDEAKRAVNLEKHGVVFEDADGFEWGLALTAPDTRRDYGEDRFVSIGPIGARLFVMVWTPRGAGRRIISLRKANKREERYYAKA